MNQPSIASALRIILNAPNLESASLSFWPGDGHYWSLRFPEDSPDTVIAPPAWTLSALVAPNRLPGKPKPSKPIRTLALNLFLHKDVIEQWDRIIPFEHITTLQITQLVLSQDFFVHAQKTFPRLRHAYLNVGKTQVNYEYISRDEICRFIANCAPLETLGLWGWHRWRLLTAILDRHGPSLKTLQLHEVEMASPRLRRRKVLSRRQVVRIRLSCPVLESFTMDMNRHHPSWQRDLDLQEGIIEELGQLGPRLRHLQIYIELGCRKQRELQAPRDEWTEPQAVSDDSEALVEETEQLYTTEAYSTEEEYSECSGDEDAEDKDGPVEENNAKYDVPTHHILDPKPSSPDQTQSESSRCVSLPAQLGAPPRGPFLPPSHDAMRRHAESMWKRFMGGPSHRSDRCLEVKWGEWERNVRYLDKPAYVTINWERKCKTRILVTAHERDDRVGEPSSRIITKRMLEGRMTFY